jgi:hypothetical protein
LLFASHNKACVSWMVEPTLMVAIAQDRHDRYVAYVPTHRELLLIARRLVAAGAMVLSMTKSLLKILMSSTQEPSRRR